MRMENSPSPAEVAPLLDEFAKLPPRPLTLSTLLSFGRPLTPESVLQSVEYVLAEVPRMFGWRVRALESLPFIVGMNPFIARILAAHRRSFKLIATYPAVTSLEENARFTEQLEALVQSHSNDIPIILLSESLIVLYLIYQSLNRLINSQVYISHKSDSGLKSGLS